MPLYPSPLHTTDLELRVGDLINYECGEWDVAAVRNTFTVDDCKLVLAMPLSKWWQKDRLYWRQAKDGCYSIKYGYWLAKLGYLPHNDGEDDADVWRGIWSLQGPPCRIFRGGKRET